ncbi:MAG TPA: undecaprenyldiphospho-muramoylpentapeptide beta-N-acetylglucosaminyltransferase [Gemmataceae bacterium]|nr:undecaprenyldiphospho-muramoylpentapeptide beta-N-acetylglucosaminyltransferase [Gemmataceae bacterium]
MILSGVSAGHCYLFAGGGTGGHLTPGLAVADELRNLDADCRIVFAGSERTLEKRLVGAEGHEHIVLPVESSATLPRHPVRFAVRNWTALHTARKLIESHKPRAVIGLGGYVSVPTVVAAARRKVPTLILEQNTVPGRATRFLARRATAVCTAFGETAQSLPADARVVCSGNPVRTAIAALSQDQPGPVAPSKPTLLILGGSQGAESLNDAIVAMLLKQLPELAGWMIVHQTGAGQHDQVIAAYRAAALPHIVRTYFDDLAERYLRATLVISRAGATTLAELACAGCPAILLPYPQAADNHQLANARVFEAAGAAIVVQHGHIPSETTGWLTTVISSLAVDRHRQESMRGAMRRLARPDAARNVLAVLQSLLAGPIK